MTAAMTSIACFLYPVLFKRFYDPENWTVGKELLNNAFVLLTIGLGNFFFDLCIYRRPPGVWFKSLAVYLFVTCIVGIIPVLVIHFIVRNNGLKQRLADAREMNRRLVERLAHQPARPLQAGKPVHLAGSTKEAVSLYPGDIIYLEASGNYVKVNYLAGESVKQKQLRATLSQVEKDLQPYASIMRCHRAFMVNTAYINNVEGNSQGFRLQLRVSRAAVPVSRSYTKTLLEKMNEA
ncbi:hypothetical protein FACS1894181_14270 [Bacteroidia bacterium]|nr:hypothetical protein FACS1894181_14270 [Bacteroidia bacterium]